MRSIESERERRPLRQLEACNLMLTEKASIRAAIAAVAILFVWVPDSGAYPTYSEGKVTHPAGSPRCRPNDSDGCEEQYGYCKSCHGHFRASDQNDFTPMLQDRYVSPGDGRSWRAIYRRTDPRAEPKIEIGLHDIHRKIMLDEEDVDVISCDTCHTRPPGFYPVYLGSSSSTFFDPIGCMGCHGRSEDAGNDDVSAGLGAGLRQHHTNAGVTECKTCHSDADPANYTPVGENVLPPYYFTPDAIHVNKPTDPCNRRRSEDYVGRGKGLDNDGDGRFDRRDPDCWARSFRFNPE